jgi:hypothetical protein
MTRIHRPTLGLNGYAICIAVSVNDLKRTSPMQRKSHMSAFDPKRTSDRNGAQK